MEYQGKKITKERIAQVVREVFEENPPRIFKIMSIGEYNRRMNTIDKQKKSKQ